MSRGLKRQEVWQTEKKKTQSDKTDRYAARDTESLLLTAKKEKYSDKNWWKTTDDGRSSIFPTPDS